MTIREDEKGIIQIVRTVTREKGKTIKLLGQ